MQPPSIRSRESPVFETQAIELARPARLTFVKLVKRGVCQFDEFLTQLEQEGGYEKEVDKAVNLMDQLARLKRLRGEQHHGLGTLAYSINGKMHEVTLYEIKTANLRLYYFHDPPTTEVIVLMGKKNTQAEDISSFESLVGQYLNYRHS
jgi:hypothetical protein